MNADRYDAAGNPEAEFEPGSNGLVLRNKLGINQTDEMDEVELDLLIQLYDEIPEQVEVDQQISIANLKAWHHRWLGNVYVWAGECRTVNIGKDAFQFAAAGQVARLMDLLERDYLSRYTPCASMTDEQLIEAIAVVHIELILIHPFREGNGRLSRLLANVMAMQACKPELDFSLWDEQKERYFSAIQAGLDDVEPMKELVRQVLPDVLRHEDV
ncbi:MAG: Fic family protein [Gammaproteobacteria bacterium]|uniref:Fic family protein n=1 Tax=Candidatus Thiopontia autotrophica TaxID=2841688 RepID=A0A8J6P6B1_9GAMM|nr:Fic family protein [Candidatus Thiopontia autotrophica]MBL6968989.1 Fic family protein [Gammaproteobacteria bacterium]